MPALIDRLRADLDPARRWPTALTQGDPTEPNIAAPLCWLDLEHAGRNAIAGDAAVLLWYLMADGGWLVPAYKPRTYATTLRNRRPRPDQPHLTHLAIPGHAIEIDATITGGTGRRAAISRLTDRLHGDLAALLGPITTDPLEALRPWLALRILGVIPLTAMTTVDAATCCAALSLLLRPVGTLRGFTALARPGAIL